MKKAKQSDKINLFKQDPLFLALGKENRDFLLKLAEQYFLSYRNIQSLIIWLRDWEISGGPLLRQVYQAVPARIKGKNRSQHLMRQLGEAAEKWKSRLPDYHNFVGSREDSHPLRTSWKAEGETLMGLCPVASEKTRCCRLRTLDAVLNCAYDCSYCSIQGFLREEGVLFHRDLKKELAKLELDPQKNYHIGTGQSSDSLVWGNKHGILEALLDFCRDNPNVILELKSKSANIDYLLEQDLPENLLVTWSLNPQVIIQAEEIGTASLDQRLDAAKKMMKKGTLIGFHFHPIIPYQDWKEDYADLASRVLQDFTAERTAMVSLGTLTYTKAVLRKIRCRPLYSKVLQMPMEEIAGKFSYPLTVKKEIFCFVYRQFQPWHKKVYFYLCMEDPALWPLVFNRQYEDNQEFEEDMIKHYRVKINQLKMEKSRI